MQPLNTTLNTTTRMMGVATLASWLLVTTTHAQPVADSPAVADSAPSAESPSVAESPAVAEPTPTAAPAEPDPNPRVKLHAIGFAFHSTMFAAENRYGYTLMGPSLAYTYFVGRRWGFALRGEMYFPLSARYAGPEADFRTGLRQAYASRRIGLDGMFLVARRFVLTPSLVLIVGGGLHVQSFKLSGVQYAPLEGITGGVGGLARLDWRVHRVVSIGGELAMGIDPIDFVRHQNRAVVTVPVSVALSLALSF
jgi:hypothetical protein